MLLATGLVHAGIWAMVGGSSQGPLSWRKPTTFGVSFGITTLTRKQAKDQAATARTIAIVGLVVGVLGLGAATYSLTRKRA